MTVYPNNPAEKKHTAELTMSKWFVSGHNFSCAEQALFIWALALRNLGYSQP